MTTRTPPGKPKGRPHQNLDHNPRNALLQAAETFLGERYAESIGIREIAEAAGTTSAMISYYFGSKQGLFIALYEERAQEMRRELQVIERGLSIDSPCPIAALIDLQINAYAHHANIFSLIRREMLDESSAMMQNFEGGHTSVVYEELIRIVRRLIELGRTKPDVDASLCAYVIASLCGHPFVMGPLFEKVTGFDFHMVRDGTWARYVTSVVKDHLYRAPALGAPPQTPPGGRGE